MNTNLNDGTFASAMGLSASDVTVVQAAAAQSPAATSTSSSSSSGLSVGALAGIIVGVVVIVALVAGIGYYAFTAKRGTADDCDTGGTAVVGSVPSMGDPTVDVECCNDEIMDDELAGKI